MNKKIVIGNLIAAMIAQGISLFLSFLTSFIVPKMLNVEMFSYWQLFIFYTTYVGFFHFGLNDGVYLKYGGKDLMEMDPELVSGQFKVLLIIQAVMITILSGIIYAVDLDPDRKFVLILVLIYMLVFNLSNYVSYIFQAANLTRMYSYSVILDKLFFMASIFILLFLESKSFQPYILCYLGGKILCLCYCLVKGRKMIFCKVGSVSGVVEELKDSMRIGIKLTVSAMSSMLILGVGRFMIDSHWEIVIFGKISFALSLTTFVLAFVQQVSMVFFPVLRRVDEVYQVYVYQTMRRFCFFVMPAIYFVMIPGKLIIAMWIPQYTDSLYYLGILLPICIFDAKMNMIFNTFFKVLRQEKKLLRINLLTLFISAILGGIGTYILDSYWFVIVSMVIAVMFRSLYSEIMLNKMLGFKSSGKPIFEVLIAGVYMYLSYIDASYLIVAGILILLYTGSCIGLKKDLKEFAGSVKGLLRKG